MGSIEGGNRMRKSWNDMTIREFQTSLASSSPTPGGGTAAAIALGQASALAMMVCKLTLNNEKWKSGWEKAEQIHSIATVTMERAFELADEDSDAFDVFFSHWIKRKQAFTKQQVLKYLYCAWISFV